MKRSFLLAFLVAVLMAGLLTFAYLHFPQLMVLNSHGTIAVRERSVIFLTVSLCAIIVIPLFILLFSFAWVYRADNPRAKKEHEPNWDHDNWLVELFWWLVPSLIVTFLAVVAWQSSHQLDPYKAIASTKPPLTVQVVALDWKWLFIYPDQHIATLNMLEIPVGTPVHFDITSDAPMNSFWIPSLGGQIMAMPGMNTQLNLMANSAGTYYGESGNISGKGFAGMHFQVQAVSDADFAAWIATAQTASTTLTEDLYASLMQPSEHDAPKTYLLSDPQLYTAIIMKYMMPLAQTPSS